MCQHNVEISTRKKVLSLVHEMALTKSRQGFYSSVDETKLKRLMVEWIDELMQEHNADHCRICRHNFN